MPPGRSTMHSFEIPGEPVPKGRARVTRSGFAYTPKRTKEWEVAVFAAAKQARIPKLSGDVAVVVEFYRKSRRRADLDNLMKGVMDALNRVAWDDDSQVVKLMATKLVVEENPHTVVVVSEMADNPDKAGPE